jgi:branched-chain amino acid transport system ATP-binding protein
MRQRQTYGAALSLERTNSILELIKELRNGGSTVLVIEHNMRAIFSICDRIAVINNGSKIAEGVPDTVKDDPVVISAYLGVRKSVA